MHSHDRTLISSLGFNDPDKSNSRHDLACQYLSRRDVASKLIGKVLYRLGGDTESKVKKYSPNIFNEEPLVKGDGKYSTVVGFLDVFYSLYQEDGTWDFVIEVKTSRIPVTDIIRQIKFYRESAKNCRMLRKNEDLLTWIVVLDFDISESEEGMFSRENIEVLRLGVGFDEFVSSQVPESFRDDLTWDASGV